MIEKAKLNHMKTFDFVNDDLAALDAGITEPKESDYPDQMSYSEAYNIFAEKRDRDDIRINLKNQTVETIKDIDSLYYYSKGQSTKISDYCTNVWTYIDQMTENVVYRLVYIARGILMIEEALKNYNFKHPETVFIRHNENITYEISDGDKKYLLRIHKAAEGLDFSLSYGDTPRQVFIESEIKLLRKLHTIGSIKTQFPIRNLSGEYVTRLASGDLVTVLSWLNGDNLVNTTITEELVYQIGQMIGKLHNATAQIKYVKRCYYDEVYIERVLYEIRKAYEVNHIDTKSYKLIETLLGHTKLLLSKEKQNFILIHDDLSKSNIIIDNGNLSPIDFSLSGYGIPEMELGGFISSLYKDEYNLALLAGYESIINHKINNSYIKAFSALSVVLYIVIHHNKVYQDEKFVKSMNRWCDTLFIFD